jgi:aerobic carbon-monoxide dehydrogenase large subunit
MATGTDAMTKPEHRMIGAPVTRREDPALLMGQGRYTADIALDDALHLAFLRSPVASGRIAAIDMSEALEAPSVVAILTGADLPPTLPPMSSPCSTSPRFCPFRCWRGTT